MRLMSRPQVACSANSCGRGERGAMKKLDSREYAWFVLCVPPQRELAVEKILSAEGYATFTPVTKKYGFANGAARARKQKTEVAIPLIPRYVFIGMSDRTPGWDRVWCYTGIFNKFRHRIATGVLGVDGKPCQVRHEPLRQFMLRHSSGAFNSPSYHRYMRQTGREFEPGDMVVTDDELFTGRVIEITDNRARVFIDIFGGGHEASIPIDKLVAI